MFKYGDKVYHKTLEWYGTFLEVDWASDKDAVVDFINDENRSDIRCITMALLEKAYACVDCECLFTKKSIEEILDADGCTCVCKSCDAYNKYIRR